MCSQKQACGQHALSPERAAVRTAPHCGIPMPPDGASHILIFSMLKAPNPSVVVLVVDWLLHRWMLALWPTWRQSASTLT